MALGLRKPPDALLTDAEILLLKTDIEAIGADESLFVFNSLLARGTAYYSDIDKVMVKGNVLPDLGSGSTHPRDLMSARAVLAHEYYGHRPYRGTSMPIGDWRDEFRASYMAAKNAPGLNYEDRRYLILDALERAKEAGVSIKYNDFIRMVLNGY
jgi:hypothetical protein